MRVAFPTNNQKTISRHIGLTKGFLIVDTTTNEKFYIENPVMKRIQEEHIKLNGECGEHGLGTGRVIPPLLKKAGVDIFVAKEVGEGMLGNLEYEDIKTIITDTNEIDTFLSQYKDSLINTNINYTRFRRDFHCGRGRGFSRRENFGRGNGRGLRRRRGF